MKTLATLAAALSLLLLAAWSPASQAQSATDQPLPEQKPLTAEQNPRVLRFHLMDGTVITGRLETDSLPIATAFGDLVVPINQVIRMSPGLVTHAKLRERIDALVADLNAPEAKRRDQAEAELSGLGPDLIPVLQSKLADDNPEQKLRLEAVLETLYDAQAQRDEGFGPIPGPAVSLNQLDTIQTQHFTIAGRILKDRFVIRSKFGQLTLDRQDIMTVEQLSDDKPEVRRSIDVSGADITSRAYKNTGIRLQRGDRLIIKADGQITMTPWGNNAMASPDGLPQNGMYNGTIAMGALAGRIGENGPEFLVGRDATITVDKPGTLYLGFAVQANWANYQFPGKFTARVRVMPAQQ